MRPHRWNYWMDAQPLTVRTVFVSPGRRLQVETARHDDGRVLPRLAIVRTWDGNARVVTMPIEAIEDVIAALTEALAIAKAAATNNSGRDVACRTE